MKNKFNFLILSFLLLMIGFGCSNRKQETYQFSLATFYFDDTPFKSEKYKTNITITENKVILKIDDKETSYNIIETYTKKYSNEDYIMYVVNNDNSEIDNTLIFGLLVNDKPSIILQDSNNASIMFHNEATENQEE